MSFHCITRTTPRSTAALLTLALLSALTSVTTCAVAFAAPPDAAVDATAAAVVVAAPAAADHPDVAEMPDVVAWLEISGHLEEGPPPFSFSEPDEDDLTLQRAVKLIERVADDNRYIGMVMYLDQPQLTHSQVYELSEAVAKVRGAGKTVFAFAEAYDLIGYLLACSADEILLQHKGMVELIGLGMEEIYLAGLFEKIGIGADLIQVGKYKGAGEPLTRTGPSDEWNENVNGLLDDLYDQILGLIAERRKLPPGAVEKVFAESWLMSDVDLLRRGVIDRLSGRDLVDATAAVFGDDFVWEDMTDTGSIVARPDNPFALFQMLFQPPRARITRDTIALIHAYGPIASGEGSARGGMFGGPSIGSRTMVEILGKVRDNDLVKGVVIRIDSPGGSALASEVIWQAVRQVGEKKPVFISVGSMAASGGYYIACAGHEIYVDPSSLVGSIGVVGGKLTLGGLYEKIGVSVHRRSRGPLGDMLNSVEPFTEAQRTAVLAAMRRIYEQFTDRVRLGRGKRVDNMEQVAQGRLFTGRQAAANGLADKVASVDVALADLAAQLDLEAGAYDVVDLPRPMNFSEFLEEMFRIQQGRSVPGAAMPSGAFSGMLPGAARSVLGPRAWRAAEPVLGGLMLLRREPVLTLLPTAVVVK